MLLFPLKLPSPWSNMNPAQFILYIHVSLLLLPVWRAICAQSDVSLLAQVKVCNFAIFHEQLASLCVMFSVYHHVSVLLVSTVHYTYVCTM